MTNEEFADALANLADHYRISSDTPQVSVSIYAGSKEELVKLLKDFGGKWKKEGDWGRTTTTSDCYVRLVSESFGVTITVLRDKVCTRTVTWECTPLLSDEDMAEVAEVEEALTNVPSPADSVPYYKAKNMIELLTSRSRYQDWLRCPRSRWWLHEWNGTGLEPIRVAIPLATGTSIHAGLASLLSSGGANEAVALALDDFDLRCAGRGLSLDELESQSFVYAEQKALTEALVRVAALRVVPRLLETYEVLEVERLDKRTLWLDARLSIAWRSIPDALLRSRDDGGLYLLSWKSCATLPDDSEARVDVQGVSEAWAIEPRLGERIRGIQMVYLVKGTRRDASTDVALSQGVPSEQVAAGARTKKTSSPLIYGYQDKSFPPKLAWSTTWKCSAPHAMRKSQWYPSGMCVGQGKNHKRGDDWTSFPVWETLGVRTWIEMLDAGKVTPEAGDCLDAQWAILVPSYRTTDQVERWARQAQSAEKRIGADLSWIWNASPDEQEHAIDRSVLGPQNTDQCHHWFGRDCPCVPLCHGDAAHDPLGSGLFQVKTQYVETESQVEG